MYPPILIVVKYMDTLIPEILEKSNTCSATSKPAFQIDIDTCVL